MKCSKSVLAVTSLVMSREDIPVLNGQDSGCKDCFASEFLLANLVYLNHLFAFHSNSGNAIKEHS